MPMLYRRKLRSRIIVSFLLLGFGLTTMFAMATIALRARLEGSLVESWLQNEAINFVAFKHAHPEPDAQFQFSRRIEVFAYRPDGAAIPFGWRNLQRGVYDLEEYDASGRLRKYKLAVQRTPDMVGYLRYDYTQEALTQQQMLITLGAAVILFTGLAWLIGLWSSSRVISPLTDLARRVGGLDLSGREKPEPLAPHFPNDEVGELASALDDYSARMTTLVKRDREFNSDVSHELRTPLAVIRGAAELLLANSDLPEKTRQRLQRIDRAALQCTDFTTALLMLSRNERGIGHTDLHKLCEALAEANRTQLAGKPVQIIVEGSNDAFINAPEAVLSVAIGNLLGNACKYTAEGEVRLVVEADRVRIEDTGPGLSAQDAARLFERGYRGSSAGSTTGGGIGLSIVRRLCELYGWDVSIAPRAEHGAVAVLVFG
ncbi:MAG TPA: HAMP domain-containing sensor histidine kinase [Arenimonas sp.]|uniref:sensor histidine kinase n=1 Tax=Arenimonas sp. TaxID=1872635 RepID=UPI002C60E62B|nr:HAMP domain-containing sensor histidine kinase [Arenimonas sp.]HMB58153.1 HAMP domain-containing sensor histidine kinase [Arenimonas sp.]